MSTHNICFRGEIRKNILWIPPLIRSVAMNFPCSCGRVGNSQKREMGTKCFKYKNILFFFSNEFDFTVTCPSCKINPDINLL